MIVVRYPRHLVALTEDELQELLKGQPGWQPYGAAMATLGRRRLR